jgi:hypothetical protein
MLPRLRTTDRLTVALCHQRARECLALTLEAGSSQPARHILEHIAESWSDIAAELKAGSIERPRSAERSAQPGAARQ